MPNLEKKLSKWLTDQPLIYKRKCRETTIFYLIMMTKLTKMIKFNCKIQEKLKLKKVKLLKPIMN